MRLLLPLILLSATALAQAPDARTIVALHAPDLQNFSSRYTVDSLVQQLNSHTRNKHVIFVGSTEDERRSGFRADFYVRIRIGRTLTFPTAGMQEPMIKPYMQRLFWTYNEPTEAEVLPRPAALSVSYQKEVKAQSVCYIAIRGKRLNSPSRKDAYSTEGPERDLEQNTIASLVQHLLEEFDKPDP